MRTAHCVIERSVPLVTDKGNAEISPPAKNQTGDADLSSPVFPLLAGGVSHWGEALSEWMRPSSRERT